MTDTNFKLINYISNGLRLNIPPHLLACVDGNQCDGENSVIFQLPYPDYEYTFLFCYRSEQDEQIGFDVCTSVTFPQLWDNLRYPKKANIRTKVHFINGQQRKEIDESEDYDRATMTDFSIDKGQKVTVERDKAYCNTESVYAIDFDVNVGHYFTDEDHASLDVIVEITPETQFI
jgi:hypothetical protein